MRTSKNILRHEWVGLKCKVVSAKNKVQTGIEGKIIDETMKTILIETKDGWKRIPKQGSIFRLKLEKCIDVDGNQIILRPEDRIKKKFKKW